MKTKEELLAEAQIREINTRARLQLMNKEIENLDRIGYSLLALLPVAIWIVFMFTDF